MNNILIERIAKLLNISIENVKNNSKNLYDIDALYFWNNSRGGISVIIGDDNTGLGFPSSVSLAEAISEYKKGRRNINLNEK